MDQLEKRYADALLDLSEEKGTLKEDLAQAVHVFNALNKQEVSQFLVHPHIENSKKRALLKKTFSSQISDHLMGLMFLMIQKNRESFILPALTEFIERTNRKMGNIEARVVSATELAEAQLRAIHKILEERLNMTVTIKTKIDPEVLSGFYILVDGQVFDGTLRTELHQMKERLKRGGTIDAN